MGFKVGQKVRFIGKSKSLIYGDIYEIEWILSEVLTLKKIYGLWSRNVFEPLNENYGYLDPFEEALKIAMGTNRKVGV